MNTILENRLSLIDNLQHKEFSKENLEQKKQYRLKQQQLINSIRDDVQNLLNTRCNYYDFITDVNCNSLLNYGLPDLGDYNPHSNIDRAKIQKKIKEAIISYEPRLQDIKVNLLESNHTEITIRIEIIALLNTMQPVAYISEFNPLLNRFKLCHSA